MVTLCCAPASVSANFTSIGTDDRIITSWHAEVNAADTVMVGVGRHIEQVKCAALIRHRRSLITGELVSQFGGSARNSRTGRIGDGTVNCARGPVY